MIVVGKAQKGGSLDKRLKIVDAAANDLEEKVGGCKILALAPHEDEINVYLIAVVEGAPKPVAEVKKSKKRGK